MVSVREVGTHVMQAGRGKPLVILHPEFAADLWSPYHDRLSEHFRVVAPDHPGFGRSQRPEWLETIDDVVLHYVELLDALGLERVSMLGTSLGGWIAAAFAVWHPERVDRLVLAAPAGIKVEGAARHDVFAHSTEETLRHLFHDPSRIAQIEAHDSGAGALLRAYRESTTLARLTWNPYYYDPKLQSRLPRITAPTLIVWGENDAFLAPAHGHVLASLIPGAALRTIDACGHLIPLEQPDAFVRLVLDFLRPDA